MNGYHIGELIGQERRRRGVTQKQLASGIFAPQMLSKLEKNLSESDILQVDILLQRLGRSPDKLEIFMPISEYEKIEERDNIEELITQNKLEEAEHCLSQYIDKYASDNNVHNMYYNRTKAHLLMRKSDSLEEALIYIKRAIEDTLPEWERKSLKEMFISTYEMENLLVYGKIMHELGKTDVAQLHLQECINYVENHYSDTEELAKIYPKCAWLLSIVLQDEKHDEMIIEYCEKALDMLRREAIGYFVPPVIEQLLHRCNRSGREDLIEFWTPIYNAFKSLYSQYAPDICQDSLFFYVYQREYHLDFETIKGERLSKGYTQENLIDGIFESGKTLSLIENHKKSASKKHYEEIMDKVGFEKRRYNGLLATESFDVLQKRNVFDYFCCANKFEEAKSVLDELEEMLDKEIADNMRFIEVERIYIDRVMNNISADKALEEYKKILLETYNMDNDDNRQPNRNEAFIICKIAGEYVEMNRMEEAQQILCQIISNYDKSRVNLKYNLRSYLLLNNAYINALYNSGERKRAMNLAEKLLKEELSWAKTRKISEDCVILACGNINDEGCVAECKRLLKAAFYIRIFNYEAASANLIVEYYKKIYSENIV